MSAFSRAALFVAIAGIGGSGRAQTPTILVTGSELRYESNGVAGAPWRVDLVEPDLALGGRTVQEFRLVAIRQPGT